MGTRDRRVGGRSGTIHINTPSHPKGMWNEPSDQHLSRMPRLYDTENTPWEQKGIYEHFFIGGSDWYAAEYDPSDRLLFGYAVLNQDYQNSEWGYFSLDDLKDIRVRGIEIDRDLHWDEQPAGSIDDIVKGMRGG